MNRPHKFLPMPNYQYLYCEYCGMSVSCSAPEEEAKAAEGCPCNPAPVVNDGYRSTSWPPKGPVYGTRGGELYEAAVSKPKPHNKEPVVKDCNTCRHFPHPCHPVVGDCTEYSKWEPKGEE